MNLFTIVQSEILDAVEDLKSEGVLPPEAKLNGLSVEPPRDPNHGDVATNAALVLAKQAKSNPRALADKIAAKFSNSGVIDKVDIAGPGFINLTLKSSFWSELVGQILVEAENYGRGSLAGGKKINIEYVSANPTGPLHVGHCRGAVFGDSLANLLEFAGLEVTREYYVNDGGAQVDILAQSAYLRYRQAIGQKIEKIPAGLYPGEYLIPLGEELANEFGETLLNLEEAEWLPVVRDRAVLYNMNSIKKDLAALNIYPQVFFSERSLVEGEHDKVEGMILWMQQNNLVYQGRLPPPKGKLPDDWEDREQTLFRSSEFGDDVDRALKKSDGSYTYFATDIAYHRNKFERGYKTMIDVWGADHGGYIKRMQAAVKAITAGEAELDIKVCQLVRLFRNGEPFKMSKRAGNFVTLSDVVDEVGKDAVRFMMLYRRNDAPLDFDFARVLEQSRDNPVFYVQYAHARAHSVFRQAHDIFPQIYVENGNGKFGLEVPKEELSRLNDDSEIRLIKKMAQFPDVVEAAAKVHEPHRIAFYLYDLAGEFHVLWNKGKESPHLRYIQQQDLELTKARLALVWSLACVLSSGLNILGVEAVEEMH